MTPPQELSRLAPALAPSTVLRRLADAGRVGEATEVAVHLSGGQVLGGRPLRVDADRGHDVVLLEDARGERLTYALLANVVALEVHEPDRVRDVLTEGRLPQPASGEAGL